MGLHEIAPDGVAVPKTKRQWWKHPILQGFAGIVLAFVLYTLALDWWFLHQARLQNDEQRRIQAAVEKIHEQQQATQNPVK